MPSAFIHELAMHFGREPRKVSPEILTWKRLFSYPKVNYQTKQSRLQLLYMNLLCISDANLEKLAPTGAARARRVIPT